MFLLSYCRCSFSTDKYSHNGKKCDPFYNLILPLYILPPSTSGYMNISDLDLAVHIPVSQSVHGIVDITEYIE